MKTIVSPEEPNYEEKKTDIHTKCKQQNTKEKMKTARKRL